MLPEFGLFFLVVAWCAALFCAACLWPPLMKRFGACLPGAALAVAAGVCLSFVTLILLRLDSDFTVLNVVMHSNRTLPTIYKISGTWGNHEGSMLLWALVLAGLGAVVGLKQPADALGLRTVAVQGVISAGVLAFVLFTSNPFERVFPPTMDGEALNPLLHDVALAMHPPLLYLGYVGFSIVFAFAVAALLEGKMDERWAARVHPWVVAAWSFLCLGIGLGSWWAYRVLGWGGFWFWDPVENASLLPWLSGTALMHANVVLKKRGSLQMWVVLLSILTFGLSLLGTFLVRSGVLTSVHSFASDPERGLFILLLAGALLGGALLLFGLRGHLLAKGRDIMRPLSREGMIVINNLFVLTACATVLLGTIYPLMSEWLMGGRVTVGPAYFNRTFLPLMAVPLLFAGLTPFMPWKKASFKKSLKMAAPAAGSAGVAMVLVLALAQRHAAATALGLGLSTWLATCSVQWLRARGSAKGAWAVFLGHVGVAVLLAGLTGAALWKEELETTMGVGESVQLHGYTVRYVQRTPLTHPDHGGVVAKFEVLDGQRNSVAMLAPEYRQFPIRDTAISVADIHSRPWYDLYAVVGEPTPDGKRSAVRLYWRPLMSFFWLGFLLMAAGGFVSILRRKT